MSSLIIDNVAFSKGFLVYRLRTKKLIFVAPMPEQVGTPTMHFLDVPGDTCQKFTSPKLGEMDLIDAIQIPCYPNGENATLK